MYIKNEIYMIFTNNTEVNILPFVITILLLKL